MSRATVLKAVRTLIAVGFVIFLGWRAGVSDLTTTSIDWALLALALPIAVASVAVRAFNHALLLNRPTRVIGAWDMFLLTLVGTGINLFLPAGAADLAKARWGLQRHGNAEAMVISSVLDKLTSLTAVAFMGTVGALATDMKVISYAAAALTVLTLLPFVAPKLMPWSLLLRFLAPKHASDTGIIEHISKPAWGTLLLVYTVSIIGWIFTYAVMWMCCIAVGAEVTMAQMFAVAPVSSVTKILPISLGGIGLGEVALAGLLASLGVPFVLAARGVLLSMVLLVLTPGAVGLLILAIGRSSDRRDEAVEDGN